MRKPVEKLHDAEIYIVKRKIMGTLLQFELEYVEARSSVQHS